MARKRKGRSISGWLAVDKPAGPSSNAVVNKVRWAFGAQKAGHAGTLDPAATGVLAVALGEATKTIPFVTDALKSYRFTMRLGQATTTDDAEGSVIAESTLRPGTPEIVAALAQFTGEIQQIPPQFSAVKVDGERAYARARDGEDVELAARPLFIERLSLIERPDADHVTLEMVCGKGGYVRSIARDLGATLGCCAHVHSLCRLASGPFALSDAVALDRIETAAQSTAIDDLLAPLECGLRDLPELPCGAEAVTRLRHGNPGRVISSEADFGDRAWASYQGKAVAVGTYRAGELHPSRVFAAQS